MSRHTHAALTSSVNPNWRTPQWLFDALHREFKFVLDAAANPEDTKCEHWLGPGSSLLDDALCGVSWWDAAIDAWKGWESPLIKGSAIFLNPPYSRDEGMGITPWVEMAARMGEVGAVVGLVPFSPQTKWYRQYIMGDTYRATEVRRFPFRLKFDPPPDYTGKASSANVNTVVVIWKPTEDYVGPWAPFERYWSPEGAPRGRANGNGGDE